MAKMKKKTKQKTNKQITTYGNSFRRLHWNSHLFHHTQMLPEDILPPYS